MTVNVPDFIPEGIASAGLGSLFATAVVENPQAPKLTEFAPPTGFPIHCDIEAWNVSLDHPKVQKGRYCLPNTIERFGRKQWSSDPLVVLYNPQEPDSEDYQAYLKLVEKATFWVADRRGEPSRQPLAVGDVADLIKIEIGGRSRLPITTEDGEDLRSQIFLSVLEVEQDVVFVA